MISAIAPLPKPTRTHIPGEVGIWIFILGDMFVFAAFFAVYTFYYRQAPGLFSSSQARLDINYGLINTFLLLTSSWFVVLGVNAVRCGQSRTSARLFALALLCGLGFAGLKIVEYAAKVAAGINPMSNDFFMYYFILTGIHLAHVMIGMVLLVVLTRAAARGAARSGDLPLLEAGACYWHMVDILWIVLFCLLYLWK